MNDVKHRYQHDPVFHAVVEGLRYILREARLAPSEVREAAMLACIIEEERNPHSYMMADMCTCREFERDAACPRHGRVDKVAPAQCSCLGISRDPLCYYHGDADKVRHLFNGDADKVGP